MDNLDTFPEGVQAMDFAASNGVPTYAPHILWEVLRGAGFVILPLNNVRSRKYMDDKFIESLNINTSSGRDYRISEESLIRRLYLTCERALKHPDMDEDITTEHLTHIAGLWMASGILTVTWESIILSTAEEILGEQLRAIDINEVTVIFKSSEAKERLNFLEEYCIDVLHYSPEEVERFLQVLLRRITPFL